MTHAIETAVIGHPVSHSKSPLIHNYWIERYGLSGTYGRIDIPPERLADGINDIIKNGMAGFNVTIPHKQAVMPLCDEVDGAAKAIGAVNTVVVKGGKLYGYNTDAAGFFENLSSHVSPQKFRQGHAVVLGAGGAARAIIHALAGQEIIVINRTFDKAVELASINPRFIRALSWDKRHDALKNASLVVNTTSLGMAGQPPLEFDLGGLSVEAAVCDIVYSPLMTQLLIDAEMRGLKIVTGIGMLLHQAVPAFEKWYGIRPDVTADLQRLVLG